MQCTVCEHKAVYEGNGQHFCKNHFLHYVESKVYKTITKYELYNQKDVICVATSGGKDSLNVLYFTANYCKKHKISFFALAIDEGIAGYRDKTLEDLKFFCTEHNVPLKIASFKDNFGKPLDELKEKGLEKNKKPCTVCGVFRRTLLNRKAKEFGATKIATGHNLDDESQSFLMNVVQGNMGHNASLGPITGITENSKFVQRVKPMYFITEKESRLYALLKGFKVDFVECPNVSMSFRAVVRDQLNEIEKNLPGAKHGIVNAFLEILPALKEKYRKEKSKKEFSYCTRCGDPSSGEVCNACKIKEELSTGN